MYDKANISINKNSSYEMSNKFKLKTYDQQLIIHNSQTFKNKKISPKEDHFCNNSKKNSIK